MSPVKQILDSIIIYIYAQVILSTESSHSLAILQQKYNGSPTWSYLRIRTNKLSDIFSVK
jgi:hypothetical protein